MANRTRTTYDIRVNCINCSSSTTIRITKSKLAEEVMKNECPNCGQTGTFIRE